MMTPEPILDIVRGLSTVRIGPPRPLSLPTPPLPVMQGAAGLACFSQRNDDALPVPITTLLR